MIKIHVVEYIKNFDKQDKTVNKALIPSREEIIKVYCESANSLCMKPWEICNAPGIFNKFNITKADFVKIIDEYPYGAMFIGIEYYEPIFSLSDEKYQLQLEREAYKLTIWNSIDALPKEQQDKVNLVIEYGNINTWKEVENLIDKIQNKIVPLT